MTCDRITIINQGEIVATDSPEHLVERLSGHSGYRVELRGDEALGLSVLQSVPGVVKVSAVPVDDGAERLSAGHLLFQVETGAGRDIGDAIASSVVTQGLELFELSRSRASLEDVFMNLTTQEPQAESQTALDALSSKTDDGAEIEAEESASLIEHNPTVSPVPPASEGEDPQ